MRTIAIAHRGDASNAIENTLAAFSNAVRAGADWIELDVQATQDGHAVILHDDTFTRLWEWEARVEAVDWKTIQTRLQGRAPRLEDVLATVAVPIMVDFKHETAVEPMVRAIDAAHAWNRCTIVSGNQAALRQVQRLAPQSMWGLTWDFPGPAPIGLLKELAVRYFNPDWQFVNAGMVDMMHSYGYQVSTWTVDAPDRMQQLAEIGVDAIVSNRIHTLVEVIARHG